MMHPLPICPLINGSTHLAPAAPYPLTHLMPRIWIVLLVALAATLPAAERLFDAGHWHASIILPAKPEPDEWYGAQSLAEWCERVTGQRPEVLSETPGRAAPTLALFVGQTEAARLAGVAAPAVEGDVAVRRVVGSAVFLLGNNPVATRIAVGRFCEQQLGIFFVQPGPQGAEWTKLTQVGTPAHDDFSPAFRWREFSGLNEVSADWAFSIGLGHAPAFSHAMNAAFGKKEWQEDPTLFPRVGGQLHEPLLGAYEPNPNLAHPKAPEMGAHYVRSFFYDHPEAFSAPFGVNDSVKFDDSVASEGWYRDRPVRTDYLIGFLNKVAASFWQPTGDLAGEHHAIGTLAYMQTLRAPSVRVHPAIFPWVCADRLGYGDPAFATQDRANVAAWAQSGARRVGVYDYAYGAPVACPRVNFGPLTAAIRATHGAGAQGWYAELQPLWAFDAPKVWLTAKLLEDPDRDPEELLRRWFAAAYGPAAGSMRAIFNTVGVAWTRDAQKGGKDQFLRHFQDERGVFVLNEAERQRIEIDLQTAQAELDRLAGNAAGPHERQRARLHQFAQAWSLYCAYRSTVAARLAEAGDMRSIESDYLRREQLFNHRWGTSGVPVRWSGFVAAAGLAKPWGSEATDAGGVSLGPDRALVEPLIDLAPSRHPLITWQSSGLHLVAPAGRLGPFPIKGLLDAGQLLRVTLTGRPVADAEAVTQLTLRFLGAGKTQTAAINCLAGGGTLTVAVPVDATRAEYEIAFTREAFIQEVSAQRITPAHR